jgi:hypothetical protein
LLSFINSETNISGRDGPLFCSFRSSVSAIKLGVFVLPLPPRGFLWMAEIEVWQHYRQDVSFTCEPQLRWEDCRL